MEPNNNSVLKRPYDEHDGGQEKKFVRNDDNCPPYQPPPPPPYEGYGHPPSGYSNESRAAPPPTYYDRPPTYYDRPPTYYDRPPPPPTYYDRPPPPPTYYDQPPPQNSYYDRPQSGYYDSRVQLAGNHPPQHYDRPPPTSNSTDHESRSQPPPSSVDGNLRSSPPANETTRPSPPSSSPYEAQPPQHSYARPPPPPYGDRPPPPSPYSDRPPPPSPYGDKPPPPSPYGDRPPPPSPYSDRPPPPSPYGDRPPPPSPYSDRPPPPSPYGDRPPPPSSYYDRPPPSSPYYDRPPPPSPYERTPQSYPPSYGYDRPPPSSPYYDRPPSYGYERPPSYPPSSSPYPPSYPPSYPLSSPYPPPNDRPQYEYKLPGAPPSSYPPPPSPHDRTPYEYRTTSPAQSPYPPPSPHDRTPYDFKGQPPQPSLPNYGGSVQSSTPPPPPQSSYDRQAYPHEERPQQPPPQSSYGTFENRPSPQDDTRGPPLSSSAYNNNNNNNKDDRPGDPNYPPPVPSIKEDSRTDLHGSSSAVPSRDPFYDRDHEERSKRREDLALERESLNHQGQDHYNRFGNNYRRGDDDRGRDNRESNRRDDRVRDNRESSRRDDDRVRDNRESNRRDDDNRESSRRDSEQSDRLTTSGYHRMSSGGSDDKYNPLKLVPKSRREFSNDDEVTGLSNKKIISNNRRDRIKVVCNHFMLNLQSKTIFKYSVEFDPPIENRGIRDSIINGTIAKVFHPFNFDGSTLIYSIKNIETTVYPYNNIEDRSGTVKVSFVKELQQDDRSLLQFYNVFMKKLMRAADYTTIGRAYFSSKLREKIEGKGLEVWSGYSATINPIESGLSLLADVAHRVVRTISVLDLIKDYERDRNPDISKNLEGKIIITRYNNKTYRIHKVEFSMTPNSTFNTNNGTSTFKDYYLRHHKLEVRDSRQPLISAQVKRRGQNEIIYLIPEFSFVTGIDDSIRSDFQTTKRLSDLMSIAPDKRYQALKSLIETFSHDSRTSKEMATWGISFAPAMQIEGNLLPVPTISRQRLDRKGDWVIVCSEQDKSSLGTFLNEVYNQSRLEKPFYSIVESRGRPQPVDFIDAIRRYLNKNKDNKPLFFLCIIPYQKSADFYNLIKRESLISIKVITQCIQMKTLNKDKSGSVVAKLLSQLTAKIGQAPWLLNSGTISFKIPERTMVVGIDVGHNASSRGKSVVAIVATLDNKLTKYYSTAIIQSVPGKEIIESLRSSIAECIKAYQMANDDKLPQLIMIYRDGVGDGMLEKVHKYEVSSVREAINDIPAQFGERPKLIYTIVKKNTNTRFFDMVGYRNPPSGTVINQGCVHKDWFEFYLISQKGGRGTINPTHYHIIEDTSNVSADDIHAFTYSLCFMYFNFDQPVRVPSVCQYAHKLSFLIGKHVHDSPHKDMSLNLYYL